MRNSSTWFSLVCFGLVFALSSLCAAPVLVQYPISKASGARTLYGVMDESLTASPIKPSKQLGESESRGLLEKMTGDYLASGWPEDALPHLDKYIEFRVTAHSGFKLSYDSIEFTLYATEGSGPRFWELRASTSERGEWNGKAGNMFGNKGPRDSSILLKKVDMNEFPQPTVDVRVDNLKSLIGEVRTGKTTLFRLYGYSAQGGQGGFYNVWGRGKDISIRGTVSELEPFAAINDIYRPTLSPIPEPRHIGLLMGVGLLGMLFLRKRFA